MLSLSFPLALFPPPAGPSLAQPSPPYPSTRRAKGRGVGGQASKGTQRSPFLLFRLPFPCLLLRGKQVRERSEVPFSFLGFPSLACYCDPLKSFSLPLLSRPILPLHRASKEQGRWREGKSKEQGRWREGKRNAEQGNAATSLFPFPASLCLLAIAFFPRPFPSPC